MAYTARTLITRAYYTSGILSKLFDTVGDDELVEGLDLLNELLSLKSIHSRLIPYFKEYSFNSVVGQEAYFVSNLIDISSITFNIDTVRFYMDKQHRRKYFGSNRADNIKSLPYSWNMERTLGGANVYLYFLPNDTYPIKIWGKFGFDQITNKDLDLTTVYDLFYITYLRLELAEALCAEYDLVLPDSAQKRLGEIRNLLEDVSPLDVSVQTFSIFEKGNAVNYGEVNLGNGWEPY
jgi:hypothetical protein